MMGLRRLDVGAEFRGKRMTWVPLVVLEGPSEPSSLNSILKPTMDFFCKHDPGGNPLAPPFDGCLMIVYSNPV